MPRRTVHRHVRELPALRYRAEHQSPAAHIAAADEVRRKTQAFAEARGENLQILAGRDAAEEVEPAQEREHLTERRPGRRPKRRRERERGAVGKEDSRPLATAKRGREE